MGPSCITDAGKTLARFEGATAVVVLETTAEDAAGASWRVEYAGESGGAPAMPVVAGYSEKNIMQFWEKLRLPNPEEAYAYLCWVRGIDREECNANAHTEACHDYHFCVLLYCKEQNLTAEQARHVIIMAEGLYNETVAQGNSDTLR